MKKMELQKQRLLSYSVVFPERNDKIDELLSSIPSNRRFVMSTRTTKIEWTDKTWNPITVCTKSSAGRPMWWVGCRKVWIEAFGLLSETAR